jgi:hypothetical protein
MAYIGGAETPYPLHGVVPLNLSFGVMFNPKFQILEKYISDLKILLDYEDILDFVTHPATADNPWLNIGFGLEIGILEILSLRGGFAQGLFTSGIGLDFGFLQFHAAMFGTELSTEPGLRPVFNIQIGIEIQS